MTALVKWEGSFVVGSTTFVSASGSRWRNPLRVPILGTRCCTSIRDIERKRKRHERKVRYCVLCLYGRSPYPNCLNGFRVSLCGATWPPRGVPALHVDNTWQPLSIWHARTKGLLRVPNHQPCNVWPLIHAYNLSY